jgi:2-hydroxychromene-2-carboxylate isomerase
MSKTIEFIFDFGSPNAYLSYFTVRDVAQRTGATLKITPCLLGGIFKSTNNQPPMMNFAGVAGKNAMFMREMERYCDRHGFTKFTMNPHFPVNTLLLMRACVAYGRDNDVTAYVEAGVKMMWENGLKMDDPEVFVNAFNDAGFDGQSLLEATQDPEVKAALVANTQGAVDRGVFGIPAFFVGDEQFFGKDHIEEMEWWLENRA